MLQQGIVSALVFGLYFTLVGPGLNLIFGVMRIVNIAHGDFLMLGGMIYGVSLLVMQTHLSSWANLLPDPMLILVLLVWPTGILGREVRRA